MAAGRDDILAEIAGIEAGYWYAWPSTHAGYELAAAGELIMAGGGNGTPLDYDELHVGYVAHHCRNADPRRGVADSRWTMTSLSAGRASGSSEVQDHGAENRSVAKRTRLRF